MTSITDISTTIDNPILSFSTKPIILFDNAIRLLKMGNEEIIINDILNKTVYEVFTKSIDTLIE